MQIAEIMHKRMRGISKSQMLVLTLFVSVSCQTAPSNQAAASQKPNIIYILADDLGYGDLGCYGQSAFQTPHLDALAADGLRFTRHYAGSAVCAPSRSVLMTGLHTGHTPVRGNGRGKTGLPDRTITVAEKLKEAGYATAMIGKWGLGDAGTAGIPNRQGFNEFVGYLDHIRAHNHFPAFLWHNQDTLPLDNEIEIIQQGYAKGVGSVSTNKVQYAQDLFDQKSLDFIEANQDTSFFIYLASIIPHANNEADDRGMEVPDFGVYQDRDWPNPQKGLAAMIARLDNTVRLLRQKLDELNLSENTIILFASDNGPHQEGGNDPYYFNSNGPLKGIKRDLYEGGIRVPMIACWPGTLPPGQVTDHISGFQDIMPTVCELAGVASPKTDGISLVPLLTGKTQPEHEYLYWEFPENGGIQAALRGDWKAVRKNVSTEDNPPLELYNLATDPGETTNLADENSGKVEEMETLLEESHTPSERFPLLKNEFPPKATTIR
jgi:uncharacterized sulfatase